MSTSTSERPNILIIYADQMRHDTMACAGNPVVKTPYLDRLAMEGVRFSEAYVSYPLCTPFRAALFSGKYAQGHGLFQNHFPLDVDQDFLPRILKESGYHTGYIGKWHLEGGPKPGYVPPGERRIGFDHFIGFNRGHQYLQSIYYKDTDQPYHCKRYEPDYQTDQLIEFIETSVAKDDGNPFFGFICYGPPHHPMVMPEYIRKMYDPEEVPLPPGVPNPDLQVETQRRRLEFDCNGNEKAHLASKVPGIKKKPGEPETEAEIRRFIAEYYGMVSNVDHNVGRVLNRLDALDVAEDTLVIFLSDHGDMMGQHGYYCGFKPTGYRAAMQVPFIVRYPAGFAGGRVTDALVDISVDSMPMILELLGLRIPNAVQGTSYLSVLDGKSDGTRDAVMYQVMKQNDGARGEFTPVPERGIRTRDWLYVRQPARRKMLFDLDADHDELNDLSEDPQYESTMDELDARIFRHMEATDDDWNLCMDFPPPGFLTHAEGQAHLEKELEERAIIVP